MILAKQSTARTLLVGPVLDADGAAKTDEVVGNLKATKNGTVGALDGSATLTHNHAGKYLLALTANDVDTLGVLQISLNDGTNEMPVVSIMVLPAAVYETLIGTGLAAEIAAVLQTGANTTCNDATHALGQLRRGHALRGGTKRSKDHSAANPVWTVRNEADSGNLVTLTRAVAGDVETITPS